MTIDKKTLARWRARVRFVLFGRPGYERYYKFIRIQRLRPDARAMRRATRKSLGYAFILMLITLPIVNMLVASDFAFASFTSNWWNPIAMGLWVWYLYTNQPAFTSTAQQQIHDAVQAHAFAHALNLLSWDLGLIIAFAIIVYWTNRNDRSLLSTEKGAANWIMPEDLAESGFLPKNYDIYAGFAPPEFERISYDANLQTEHIERIRTYTEAVAAHAANLGAVDDAAIIVLPIYGDNDASRATGASQTDVNAPWHATASTLPDPDTEITVPTFD